MLYPRNADALIEARRALDADELSDPFAELVSDYLEQHVGDDEQATGVLYLNASCALIHDLSERQPSAARDDVLTLIYHIAKLFSGRTLNAQDASASFQIVTTSIMEMMRRV
jgi:hypothetical protein